MFVALTSMACSTTVREREVVYVPAGVQTTCPCPAVVTPPRAASAETYVGRDAVPRTSHAPPRSADHAKQQRNGVKWGRSRAKSKRRHPPGLEIAKAERAEHPPGLTKRRHREKAHDLKDKDKDQDKQPAK